MSQTISVTCDECGRVKGETNHWFKVSPITAAHFIVSETNAMEVHGAVLDACGSQCVLVAMSKWFEAHPAAQAQKAEA